MIAQLLGRHQSSISRELSRNTGNRGYRPQQADQRYQERGQSSRNARRVDEVTQALVAQRLKLQWSPEIPKQLIIYHHSKGCLGGCDRCDDATPGHKESANV